MKFSAHYIFPGGSPPLKFGVVEADDCGTIIDLVNTGGKLYEMQSLEFYEGIISPAFQTITSNDLLPFPDHFSEMRSVNWSRHAILDILRKMQESYPFSRLELLLDWATIYLAKNLNKNNENGAIKIGQKPGLILITDIDFSKMKLTSHSQVKVLI